MHDNGTYTLSNSKGPMKQKARAVNLKPFLSSNDPVPSDSPSPAFTWTPVSKSWQTEKSEVCGLNFCKNRSSDESHPIPLKTKRTKGDGNCFFCALSSVITDREEWLLEVRILIVSFMEENVERFENMHNENMYGLAEWATDAEVMGAAAFLKTPISVHMTNRME